jgi:pimeloyl-ACP methyl ester carboxylesterase
LPTLLIWGEQDRIIPVAHGYAAHDAVPGSRLEVLAGVGHFPHVEAPTAVVGILDDFIATTAHDVDLTIQQPDRKGHTTGATGSDY